METGICTHSAADEIEEIAADGNKGGAGLLDSRLDTLANTSKGRPGSVDHFLDPFRHVEEAQRRQPGKLVEHNNQPIDNFVDSIVGVQASEIRGLRRSDCQYTCDPGELRQRDALTSRRSTHSWPLLSVTLYGGGA